eukprot:CAMPEP_0170550220 /NCGR_PEP_ID=MMETSP0211-20121228/8288_1 /TAXON_ID=311385 /ORGANISM="Pseudokeronopsis sp., Strain OXSARD2" /LENGTH=74 /DNA_ID=CAMNT_0010856651 /DNA_START=501 /DNA_END=725 /DNA_ORIENTATION=+
MEEETVWKNYNSSKKSSNQKTKKVNVTDRLLNIGKLYDEKKKQLKEDYDKKVLEKEESIMGKKKKSGKGQTNEK